MRYEPGRMAVTPLGWTDPRTQEKELLAPELFPESVVAKIEKSLGAYGTAGQLQQRPTPKEGGMFKEHWFKQRVRAAPYQAARVRYWDRAATPEGGCRTVGSLLCKSTEGNLYVEHVVAGQWGPDERDEIILDTALRDRKRYGPKHAPRIYIEQEPGSAGIDSYRHIARKLQGFPVYADRVTGAKEVMCIQVLGGSKRRVAYLGDIIKVHVRVGEHSLLVKLPEGRYTELVALSGMQVTASWDAEDVQPLDD